MGGNSTKATSGINGAGTQTQQELGIPDNAKIFFEDTKKSVSFGSSQMMTWAPLMPSYLRRHATLPVTT